MIDAAGNGTDRDSARSRLFAQAQLLQRGLAFLAPGAALGKVAVSASLRRSLPVLEFYSGLRARDIEVPTDANGEPLETGTILDLDYRQSQVVIRATTKLFSEAVELAQFAYPVSDQVPVFASRPTDGRTTQIHLAHLISLGMAAQDLFWKDDKNAQTQEPGDQFQLPANCTVSFLAVAPNEYVPVTGPQPAREIWRSAMRLRSYEQPELAVRSINTQPIAMPLMAAGVAQPAMSESVQPLSAAARRKDQAMRNTLTTAKGSGCGVQPCGCGGGTACSCGGSCGCGDPKCCGCGSYGRPRPFGEARYDDAGKCMSIASISCETQWRIRDCFKYALCDVIACYGHRYCCEDEPAATSPAVEPVDCVKVFLCSFLECVPRAICPPVPPRHDCCCHTAPEPSCACNFAVGE